MNLTKFGVIIDYYRAEFCYKRDFYDRVGGKIYPYEAMKEALYSFIEKEGEFWRKRRLDILGFIALERAVELGLSRRMIRCDRCYFAECIREMIAGKDIAVNVDNYPNANSVIEQAEMARQYNAREVDISSITVTEFDGIKRIRSSDLARLLGRNNKGAQYFKYPLRLGYEPYFVLVPTRSAKTQSKKVHYLKFEECLVVLEKKRYRTIREQLVNELRMVFGC